jgi:hypothetical protein
MNQLEELLASRVNDTVRFLQYQVAMEQAGEEDLQRTLEEDRKKVKALDIFLLEDERILAQIARLETLYDSTLEQLTDNEELSQSFVEGRISILARDLDGPALVSVRVGPQPPLFLSICMAFGLLAVIVVAYESERRSKRTGQ